MFRRQLTIHTLSPAALQITTNKITVQINEDSHKVSVQKIQVQSK